MRRLFELSHIHTEILYLQSCSTIEKQIVLIELLSTFPPIYSGKWFNNRLHFEAKMIYEHHVNYFKNRTLRFNEDNMEEKLKYERDWNIATFHKHSVFIEILNHSNNKRLKELAFRGLPKNEEECFILHQEEVGKIKSWN